MNRKEFIRSCGVVCLGGMTAPALLTGCSTSAYVAQYATSPGRILIKKSEFIKVTKNKTVVRKFILVRPEGFEFPVCIFNLGNENYSALLMKCTHKGCELQPQASHLVCPCHGSEFNNTGIVQNPPAEENLQTFNVISENENIILQL